MLTIISAAEMAAKKRRVSHLYQSRWLVDNLTAILMDTTKGDMGLHEGNARAKVHAVIEWLHFKRQMRRFGENYKQAQSGTIADRPEKRQERP